MLYITYTNNRIIWKLAGRPSRKDISTGCVCSRHGWVGTCSVRDTGGAIAYRGLCLPEPGVWGTRRSAGLYCVLAWVLSPAYLFEAMHRGAMDGWAGLPLWGDGSWSSCYVTGRRPGWSYLPPPIPWMHKFGALGHSYYYNTEWHITSNGKS